MDFCVKNVENIADYDLLIAGAGMGGITAAIAAAEAGLKVGIIEYFGEPGGIPVSGRLGSISGFGKNGASAVEGLPLKIINKLERDGKTLNQFQGSNINIPPTTLVSYIFELIEKYNIDIYLYTQVIGVDKTDTKINKLIVTSKDGIKSLSAKKFIDATGDGDLAFMAGCPFEMGRSSDGKVQSATLVFIIGGIDLSRIPEYIKVREIWKSKPRNVPINHSVFQFVPHNENSNEIAVNMVHVLNVNGINSNDLTKIRIDGIKQAEYLMEEFFRKEIAGFEKLG